MSQNTQEVQTQEIPLLYTVEIPLETTIPNNPESLFSPAIVLPTKEKVEKIIKPIDTEYLNEIYKLETKHLREVTENEISEIVMNYREDFGYAPWGEYKKCYDPECLFKVSIEEYYNIPQDTYIPLKELEQHGKKDQNCPCCPTHKDLNVLVDYASTEELTKSLKNKFAHDGYITLLKNDKQETVGYTWGYKGSFLEALQLEFKTHLEHSTLVQTYMERATHVLNDNFNLDSPVFVWNMLGINRKHRTFENFNHLCRKLLSSIPDEYQQLPVPGECNRTIDFYNTLKMAGAIDICESLYENYVMILLAKELKDLQTVFCNSPIEYKMKYGEKYLTYKKMQKQQWKPTGLENVHELEALANIGYNAA